MMSFLLITQDPEWASRIREQAGEELGEFATTDKVASPTLEDTLAVIEHADPAVVVVGPDIATGVGLFLARALDERAPDTTVVLVADPTPQLLERAVRAGVRDVIDPLAEDDFVYMALEDALERAMRRRSRIRAVGTPEAARAKVVTVVSPKGGAGKTVTTTNIAVGLGRVAPNEVVVVDLDVQFGDVANALRLTPETTIADVARSGSVDATTVKAFLTPHPGNFFVLCAPETPAEADLLKPELIGETIELLAQMFRYVVVDTAAGLDEMTLTAIEHSTDLVVMCATDVSSARGLRKELDAFEILGFTTQRRHFALNRADARVGLDAEDIKSTVGLDVAVSIPSSRIVPTAMNQGTPVLELEQRSPVARAFADLVAQIADLSTPPQPVATGGGLFRRVKEMR